MNTENSDNPKLRRKQRALSYDEAGVRIIQALDGRTRGWLSEKTGIPPQTLSGYLRDGIAKPDAAITIARALEVDLEWLLTGTVATRDALDSRSTDQSMFEDELLECVRRLSAREKAAILSLARLLGQGGESEVIVRRTVHSPALDFKSETASGASR